MATNVLRKSELSLGAFFSAINKQVPKAKKSKRQSMFQGSYYFVDEGNEHNDNCKQLHFLYNIFSTIFSIKSGRGITKERCKGTHSSFNVALDVLSKYYILDRRTNSKAPRHLLQP